MKEIILIKNGEIALKGLNRRMFEDVLVKNIKRRIGNLGRFEIRKAQSAIFIEPLDGEADLDEAALRISRIFGIAALSRAAEAPKDMERIVETAREYLKDELENAATFKVEARRSDKSFPLKSPEISARLGGELLAAYPHLSVDVHRPDVTVTVEIRDFGAYVRGGVIPGAGGMPVGTGGKAAILISGGIDSPVAAYMMAKRGIELTAVHFASPPYTSERAEQKVLDLLTQVSQFSGRIRLFIVPFTTIQEEIGRHCPEELFTLIMRRFMMTIAQRLAEGEDCKALITGESVGQVASQTIQAIACTDAVCRMPVFRPVIGMDKEEIVQLARKIGTFDISIQPYEDCCTVFTPRHPRTRPSLPLIEKAEAALDFQGLAREACGGARAMWIG